MWLSLSNSLTVSLSVKKIMGKLFSGTMQISCTRTGRGGKTNVGKILQFVCGTYLMIYFVNMCFYLINVIFVLENKIYRQLFYPILGYLLYEELYIFSAAVRRHPSHKLSLDGEIQDCFDAFFYNARDRFGGRDKRRSAPVSTGNIIFFCKVPRCSSMHYQKLLTLRSPLTHITNCTKPKQPTIVKFHISV